MSDKVEDTKPVVCRLCMSTESGQIQLFHGKERSPLCQKIKGCLSIQINWEDTLSKFVCRACVCRVDDFYVYQQICLRTQSVLEKYNFHPTQEVSTEAEKIVERVQAGRSALSITPVGSNELQKIAASEDVFDSAAAFSITPILRNSEDSGDENTQWDFPAPFEHRPHLKNPSPEDYILIQEESFTVDPAFQYKRNPYEYRLKHEDYDVVGTQLKRRVVLPPMWDVYEKGTDSEIIIHRRYIISKKSFSCSLCGSCVAFHCQEVLDSSKSDSQIKVTLQDMMKAKQASNDEIDVSIPEGEAITQDSRCSPSSQDGILDCPECGKLFPRRSSWKRHLRSHFEGRSFLCPMCGKGFSRKEHLSRHITSHTGGRPFCCESCTKPFTRKEHLARHLACNPACARNSLPCLDQEPGSSISRPYTCGICFQSFMDKEHLQRHRRRAHFLMDGCITPPFPSEEDFRLLRCNNCNISFATKVEMNEHMSSCHEYFTHTVPVENEELPLPYLKEKNSSGSPEQIEVEVNLVEDGSDIESVLERGTQDNEEGDPLVPPFALMADQDAMEPDQDDTLRLQMSEAMRKAPVNSESSKDAMPHCEVCQKSFTHQSHLIRHLNDVHPHVKNENATTHSLGKLPSVEDLETSASFIDSSRDDDDDEADDESGSTQSSLPSNPGVTVSISKGRHPCSICGRTFGRRYHLVRHRRTQHGVESVRTGPLGRPAKGFVVSKPFYCSVCDGQFSSRNAYRLHLCMNLIDSNNSSLRGGSEALAEMAAKISDKLHRGMDSLDFSCKNCSQKFCNELELDKHMETHVDDVMR